LQQFPALPDFVNVGGSPLCYPLPMENPYLLPEPPGRPRPNPPGWSGWAMLALFAAVGIGITWCMSHGVTLELRAEGVRIRWKAEPSEQIEGEVLRKAKKD
jgi:hypothetical protein